jgi:hypothetical protein
MTFYFPETEDNRLLREFGGPMLPSTLGETMGAAFGDPTLRPTELLGTGLEMTEARRRQSINEILLGNRERQRRFQEELPLPEDERFDAEPLDMVRAEDLDKITAAEATEKYGYLGLKFDAPVNPDVAEILAKQKQQERIRQDILARGPEGVVATAARFGASFAGAAIDPLNIAAAFIPVVGEARYAGLVARFGLTGGRAARGVIEGVVGSALIEPAVYGLAREQQLDYTMSDALANVAFGGILGGGLHAVGGRIGDFLMRRDPVALEAALRASVAQAASGRLVDIEPVLREDFVTTESRFMRDLQTGTALTTRGVIDADIPLRDMLRLSDEREAVMVAALDRHGEALVFATRAEAERESRRRFGEFDVAEQEGQFVLRQPTQMEPLRGSQGEVREFPNERAAERFARQSREEGLSVVPVARPGERPAFALVRGGTPEQVAALKAKPELASMPRRPQLSLETGRMAPQEVSPDLDRALQRIAREQAERAFAPERKRSADFPAAARADATVRAAPKVYDGDSLEAQLDGIRQEVEGLFKAGMVKEDNVRMINQATQEAMQHVESFSVRARAAAACLVRAA